MSRLSEPDAGRFMERLGLLKPVPASDALGGHSSDYVSAGSIWARLESTASSVRVEESQRQAKPSYRMLIRTHPAIAEGWQVRWRGRSYRVDAIVEQLESRLLSLLIVEGELA